MLEPGMPSQCCKDKNGKLTGTDPDQQKRTWDPITKTGILYCSECHRSFRVSKNEPPDE